MLTRQESSRIKIHRHQKDKPITCFGGEAMDGLDQGTELPIPSQTLPEKIGRVVRRVEDECVGAMLWAADIFTEIRFTLQD